MQQHRWTRPSLVHHPIWAQISNDSEAEAVAVADTIAAYAEWFRLREWNRPGRSRLAALGIFAALDELAYRNPITLYPLYFCRLEWHIADTVIGCSWRILVSSLVKLIAVLRFLGFQILSVRKIYLFLR